MPVCIDGMGDAHPVEARSCEVNFDVPPRIEDEGTARLFVAHQIGSMTQTLEIELLKEHE
jgi:hypothetical protein